MSRSCLATVLLLAGCGASMPPTVPSPSAPVATPSVTVHLASMLGWPFTIARVVVMLDGAPLLIADPRQRALPGDQVIGAVATGTHTVAVLFDVELPCGLAGAQTGHVRIRGASTFSVAPHDATVVDVRLYGRGLLADVPSRLALALTVAGANGVATPPTVPAAVTACAAKHDPLAHADCVVSASLADARRARDVLEVTCEAAALRRIHALRAAAQRLAADDAPDPSRAQVLAWNARVAEHDGLACAVAGDDFELGETLTESDCGNGEMSDWVAELAGAATVPR